MGKGKKFELSVSSFYDEIKLQFILRLKK